MCNLSNFWWLDIIVCCCAAMQNAGTCEEVLAAGACFLPLVPASFCFAMPSLMTACLRMQMGLVEGPGRQLPTHHAGLRLTDGICFAPPCAVCRGATRWEDGTRQQQMPCFTAAEEGVPFCLAAVSVAAVWVPAVLGAAGAGTSRPWDIQGARCTWWHPRDRRCCRRDAWLCSDQA